MNIAHQEGEDLIEITTEKSDLTIQEFGGQWYFVIDYPRRKIPLTPEEMSGIKKFLLLLLEEDYTKECLPMLNYVEL